MTPIELSFDSSCTANELGMPGTWRPITVCDHCGDRIESAGNCTVEHHEDVSGVAYCHKNRLCQRKYRQSRHTLDDRGWGWFEMRDFLSFVSRNLDGSGR